MNPIILTGELSILSNERRLIVDYFTSRQRDLADVIRHQARDATEAFGIVTVGDVRITVDFDVPLRDVVRSDEPGVVLRRPGAQASDDDT